jgi:sarcosine oxidase subunit beta
VRESVDLFVNFSEVTGQRDYDPAIRRQGYLWLTTSESVAESQRRLVAVQHSWGLTDVELLDGDETRYRFPYVAPSVVQSRFRQDDGFLDPKEVTMGMAAASGGEAVTSCAVTGFRIRGDRLEGVETERGFISTRTAVIAAGPFSGPVAALARVGLPLSTVRRQKVVLPEIADVPRDAPLTIDEDTGVHWRPAGTTGAYLLFTDPQTPPSPPAEDVPVDHGFAFQLLDPCSPASLGRVSPFWDQVWERGTANWMIQAGQYTMTPDHRPLIGETGVEGLFINGGYSGHGIMGSPAGSRHLIDLMAGKTSAVANPFRLDRPFNHPPTDVL